MGQRQPAVSRVLRRLGAPGRVRVGRLRRAADRAGATRPVGAPRLHRRSAGFRGPGPARARPTPSSARRARGLPSAAGLGLGSPGLGGQRRKEGGSRGRRKGEERTRPSQCARAGRSKRRRSSGARAGQLCTGHRVSSCAVRGGRGGREEAAGAGARGAARRRRGLHRLMAAGLPEGGPSTAGASAPGRAGALAGRRPAGQQVRAGARRSPRTRATDADLWCENPRCGPRASRGLSVEAREERWRPLVLLLLLLLWPPPPPQPLLLGPFCPSQKRG